MSEEAARAVAAPDRRPPVSPGNRRGHLRGLSDERCSKTFEHIRQATDASEPPVETFILSMTHQASDVLSVQLLARRAGLLEADERGRCTRSACASRLFRDHRGPGAGARSLQRCWRTPSTDRRGPRREPARDHARLQRLRQGRGLRDEQLGLYKAQGPSSLAREHGVELGSSTDAEAAPGGAAVPATRPSWPNLRHPGRPDPDHRAGRGHLLQVQHPGPGTA